MVVLSAAITTRSGKPILARQFRQMQRSRVEALLAAFPKLADTAHASQHTTVEQDNVRFVYQPLDELYMVLITNRQSNILQDIATLHLFAQLVASVCKGQGIDERVIARAAFDLLPAFDEIVTLGYRENLTPAQIKTFLDMDSHEERIQEIIARNKELEASEERKRKAKQLEMQRKEMSRQARVAGSSGMNMARPPTYPTYTPPAAAPAMHAGGDAYDSYNAAKNPKPMPVRGKGMQLGKKKGTTSMYDAVRADLGPDAEPHAPLAGVPVPAAAPVAGAAATSSQPRTSLSAEAIQVTIAETISCRLSREGTVESFGVNGNLQLRIADPALTQVKLDLTLGETHGARFDAHPKVDKAAFKRNTLQLADTSKGFPINNSVTAMRWKLVAPSPADIEPPIKFTVWPSQAGDDTSSWSLTIEYELTDPSVPLKDVVVVIPYPLAEPAVSSFDAVYEVSGDSLDWQIGDVDASNATGSFEFEAPAHSEADFFPMTISFTRSRPWVTVDVSDVQLIAMGQSVGFSKDVRSVAEGYKLTYE